MKTRNNDENKTKMWRKWRTVIDTDVAESSRVHEAGLGFRFVSHTSIASPFVHRDLVTTCVAVSVIAYAHSSPYEDILCEGHQRTTPSRHTLVSVVGFIDALQRREAWQPNICLHFGNLETQALRQGRKCLPQFTMSPNTLMLTFSYCR
jgi:hypothetical protein